MHHLYRVLWLSVRAVSHVSAAFAVGCLIILAIPMLHDLTTRRRPPTTPDVSLNEE
jgi:hypothetical protein